MINERQRKAIIRRRKKGWGMRSVCEALHLGSKTVMKVCREEGYTKLSHYRVPTGRKLSRRQIRIPSENTKVSYLAGIIDGEGSIYATGRTKMSTVEACVEFSNSSEDLMQWVVKEFGGRYKEKRIDRTKEVIIHLKTMYEWKVNRSRDVHALLKALSPYLQTAKLGDAYAVMETIEKKYPHLSSKGGHDMTICIH